MAAPIDVLFTQRFLSSGGFSPGALDGSWGPKTHAAQDQFEQFSAKTKTDLGAFDARSETCILTLQPKAQVAARKFLTAVKSYSGIVKIISGTRTYAEQDALATKVPKVTNAHGGQSLHNFGIAWDFGVFVNGKYYTGANAAENKAYHDIIKIAREKVEGIDFGADWISFVDLPHVQIEVGKKSVGQLRELFEAGKPLV